MKTFTLILTLCALLQSCETCPAAVQIKGGQEAVKIVPPEGAPTYEKLQADFQSTAGVRTKWTNYVWTLRETGRILGKYTHDDGKGNPQMIVGLLRRDSKHEGEDDVKMWAVYKSKRGPLDRKGFPTWIRKCFPLKEMYLSNTNPPPRPHAAKPRPRNREEHAAAGHPLSEVKFFRQLSDGTVEEHFTRFGDVTYDARGVPTWNHTNVVHKRGDEVIGAYEGKFVGTAPTD